jgi:hypothetical protein
MHNKIPKLTIEAIGNFDNDGRPINWKFNGAGHANSVGSYVDLEKGIYLCGGYTIEELKEIYISHVNEGLRNVNYYNSQKETKSLY